jgi:hypothetical protein
MFRNKYYMLCIYVARYASRNYRFDQLILITIRRTGEIMYWYLPSFANIRRVHYHIQRDREG